MRLAVLSLLAVSAFGAFPNGYTYRRSITIPASRVTSGAHTNFPALIIGTYSYLATVANGGELTNSNGYDLIFTSDYNGTTLLNWELASYVATTGYVQIRVQIPSLSSSTDNVIYMFTANAAVTTFQSPANPWDSNYKAVWHFGTSSSLTLTSGASITHTLTNSTAVTAVAGKLDGGASFDGANFLDGGSSADFEFGTGDGTVEMWVQPGTQAVDSAFIAHFSGSAGWMMFTSNPYLWYSDINGTLDLLASLTASTWTRIAWTKSGTSFCSYQNGTALGCITRASDVTVAANLLLGKYAAARLYTGLADEVLFSKGIARSAGWIQTMWSNEDSPTLFYSVGSSTTSTPSLTCQSSAYVAMVGFPYSAGLTVSGGITPYTYSITAGSLPTGLSLNASTGIISGTPSGSPGASPFTAHVVDGAAASANASCSITVVATEPLAPRTLGNQTSGWHWYGPKTVIAGRDTWFTFALRWSFPISCDVATQTCDTHGTYTPTGTEDIVTLYSTASLPTGQFDIYGNQQASYKICDVSGTTFKLREAGGLQPTDCSGPVRAFTDTGTGILYVRLNQTYTGTHQICASVTGTPAGSTANLWYLDGFVMLYPANPCDLHTAMLQLNVPVTTSPGATTFNFTLASDLIGTDATTIAVPINVVVLAPTSTALQPSSYPAIPGLSTWETSMLSGSYGTEGGAPAWCDKSTGTTYPDPLVVSANTESVGAWYYDGPRVYKQVAAYTGDSAWLNCASGVGSQYVDTLLPYRLPEPNPPYGWPNGYKAASPWPMFSTGMRMLGGLDARYRYMVTYMGRTTLPPPYFNPPGPNQLRPMSVQLDAFLDEVALGFPLNSTAKNLAEQMCQAIHAIADGTATTSPGEVYVFMMGMAFEALIRYYDLTHDPLIPYTVKLGIDWIYSNAYSATTHAFAYDAYPEGPSCSCPNATCPAGTTSWFVTDATGTCNQATDTRNETSTALNNMVVPAWAWYWRISGDDTYRTQGDDAFQHALDDVGVLSTGKLFCQQYRWSFDYVRWRSGH